MCTVDICCTRLPAVRAGGATILNVTSGGMDSGAEPILERHGELVANVLAAIGGWRAGNRNAGIEIDVELDVDVASAAHRRRAGASMAVDAAGHALGKIRTMSKVA